MTRRRDQDGFIMVITMGVLMVLLLLTAATITQTVAARGTSTRGTMSTRSLQAADSALNQGWQAMNMMKLDQPGGTQTDQTNRAGCITESGGAIQYSTGVASGSWCPKVAVAVPGVAASTAWPNDGAWYQISGPNTPTSSYRTIIAWATVRGVTRRLREKVIQTSTTSTSSSPLFQGFAVLTKSDLFLGNQTYIKGGGAWTDGSMTWQDNAGPYPRVCGGQALYGNGAGKTFTAVNNPQTCAGMTPSKATTALTLTAVSQPTGNDTSRLTAYPTCKTSSTDTCTGNSTVDVQWDGKNLTLANSGTYTLKGNAYWLCSLDLKSNTQLIVSPANKQPVVFYFYPPTSTTCNMGSGARQLYIENSSRIVNNTTAGAKGIQFMFGGNGSATLDNTAIPLNLSLYAPQSYVELINQVELQGAVAANQINMTANAHVIYDTTAAGVTGGSTTTVVPGPYAQSAFRECPMKPGGTVSPTAPDTGC